MFTIKTKIIAAYTALFGIMLIVFSIIIYNSNKEALLGKLDTDLKSYSLALQTELIEQLNESSSPDLRELRTIRAEGLTGVRFRLFGPSNKEIISDSILNKAGALNNIKLSDDGNKLITFTTDGIQYRAFFTLFETVDDSTYTLQTAASMKDAYENADRLYYLFLILIPIGLIITGLSALLISKSAFKPITGMINTAKEISGKNLTKRLEIPKANDEIKLLGETFNEMLTRIDNAFQSQRRFTASASHEIKTPLTVIQSELEYANKKSDTDEVKKSIKTVLSEIDSLNTLTNSLLTLAKLDSMQIKLNMECVRLDEILVEAVQFMNLRAASNKINLNLTISEPCEISADKEKIKSVFINLIDNAVKYSPRESTVMIELFKTGSFITVSVSDEGPGISREEILRIFDRFYRSEETRGRTSGSGLGLSIVKEFIEMHGGRTEVSSGPGKGSRFEVILPLNSC